MQAKAFTGNALDTVSLIGLFYILFSYGETQSRVR